MPNSRATSESFIGKQRVTSKLHSWVTSRFSSNEIIASEINLSSKETDLYRINSSESTVNPLLSEYPYCSLDDYYICYYSFFAIFDTI